MSTPNPTPNTTQPKKFNPLSQSVNEKNYSTNPTAGLSQNELLTDIPEPTFTPPPIDLNDIPRKEPKAGSAKPEQKQPFNPALNELSDSERSNSAAQMAAFMMTMYEKLHEFGNNLIKIPERKIQRLQMENLIDLTVPVPYQIGQFVQLDEFINEYNAQAGTTFEVKEDFKKSVLPPLTRILAKRGHGMSDEQYVAFMFFQDLSVKGYQGLAMYKQTKSIINFAIEQTAAARQRPVQPIMQPINQVQQPAQQSVTQPDQPVAPAGLAPVIPIQDRVMQQHSQNLGDPSIHQNTGLPQFGNPGVLTTMDDIYQKELQEKNKKERIRKRLENNPPDGKKRLTKKNVPGAIPSGLKNTARKKPGPKPGSKRKPKAIVTP